MFFIVDLCVKLLCIKEELCCVKFFSMYDCICRDNNCVKCVFLVVSKLGFGFYFLIRLKIL